MPQPCPSPYGEGLKILSQEVYSLSTDTSSHAVSICYHGYVRKSSATDAFSVAMRVKKGYKTPISIN